MPTMTSARARAPRPQLIHTLALAGLLTACTFGPGGGSPSPTPGPTGSPTPTATPSPTPSPTVNPDQIEHPTGATDIVLRWEMGGGFVPLEVNLTHVPQFTLYGDGTVVFRSSRPWSFGEPPPPMLTGKMTEEGIQALLTYALDTGGLATAKANYDNQMIADASTTTFVLNAGGASKVVTIYALGEGIDMGAPDQADRARFAQLQNLLMNFEAEATSGTVDELTEYDAEFYRVILLEDMGGQPINEPIEWPWDDVALDDFPAGGDEPGRIMNMPREQVAELVEVPNYGQAGIWVVAPDDTLVQLAVRPLLPDEIAAAEL